jgi:hypothetical protein
MTFCLYKIRSFICRRDFDENIIDKVFKDVSQRRSRIILWGMLNFIFINNCTTIHDEISFQ